LDLDGEQLWHLDLRLSPERRRQTTNLTTPRPENPLPGLTLKQGRSIVLCYSFVKKDEGVTKL